MRLLISADGQPIAELTADQFRADVAGGGPDWAGRAGGGRIDPSCGFAYAFAAGVRRPDHPAGSACHAGPQGVAEQPDEIALPSSSERGRILALIDRADELFRFAHELRRELRAVLPADRYSLANYEHWARQNQEKIAARAAIRYGETQTYPLISILCPVFRPKPAGFSRRHRQRAGPKIRKLGIDPG